MSCLARSRSSRQAGLAESCKHVKGMSSNCDSCSDVEYVTGAALPHSYFILWHERHADPDALVAPLGEEDVCCLFSHPFFPDSCVRHEVLTHTHTQPVCHTGLKIFMCHIAFSKKDQH